MDEQRTLSGPKSYVSAMLASAFGIHVRDLPDVHTQPSGSRESVVEQIWSTDTRFLLDC